MKNRGPNMNDIEDTRSELGLRLIEQGIITEIQLKEVEKLQREKGGFLGQLLVEMGIVKQDVLIQYLVKQCKIPHLSILDYNISKDLLFMIPGKLCIKHKILPIDKLGRILTIAMVDPLDTLALEKIRSLYPDLRIKPILCNWNHFNTVINRLFDKDGNVMTKDNDDDKISTSQKMQSICSIPGNERACIRLSEDTSNWYVDQCLEILVEDKWGPIKGVFPTPMTAIDYIYQTFNKIEEFRMPINETYKYYRKIGMVFVEIPGK